MLKLLLYKWFGLEPIPCATCEVLREQLAGSERERRDLLNKLLDKEKPEPLIEKSQEEMRPIQPQFIPWRVKQQMLEAEDRKQKQLLEDKHKEIAALEKEMGLANEG